MDLKILVLGKLAKNHSGWWFGMFVSGSEGDHHEECRPEPAAWQNKMIRKTWLLMASVCLEAR